MPLEKDFNANRLTRRSIEEILKETWEQTLGIEGIGPSDNFLDLGGDSLTAMIWLNRFRARTGLDISLESILLDARTLREVAAFVERALGIADESNNDLRS